MVYGEHIVSCLVVRWSRRVEITSACVWVEIFRLYDEKFEFLEGWSLLFNRFVVEDSNSCAKITKTGSCVLWNGCCCLLCFDPFCASRLFSTFRGAKREITPALGRPSKVYGTRNEGWNFEFLFRICATKPAFNLSFNCVFHGQNLIPVCVKGFVKKDLKEIWMLWNAFFAEQERFFFESIYTVGIFMKFSFHVLRLYFFIIVISAFIKSDDLWWTWKENHPKWPFLWIFMSNKG